MKIQTINTVELNEADIADCIAYTLKRKHNLNVDVNDIKRKLACNSHFSIECKQIELRNLELFLKVTSKPIFELNGNSAEDIEKFIRKLSSLMRIPLDNHIVKAAMNNEYKYIGANYHGVQRITLTDKYENTNYKININEFSI